MRLLVLLCLFSVCINSYCSHNEVTTINKSIQNLDATLHENGQVSIRLPDGFREGKIEFFIPYEIWNTKGFVVPPSIVTLQVVPDDVYHEYLRSFIYLDSNISKAVLFGWVECMNFERKIRGCGDFAARGRGKSVRPRGGYSFEETQQQRDQREKDEAAKRFGRVCNVSQQGYIVDRDSSKSTGEKQDTIFQKQITR